ncbi:MAG: peptidase domain protein [Planctomycetaceae bacterium]|nr:peptidase domain protein [Planctomycetaceae bacterium]
MSALALAQLQAPSYEECRLDSIFPSGGRRGTSVKIELKGLGNGLTLPKDIVIDGPPGITAKDLKSVNGNTLEATLEITPDAPLGRRWLRVLNERSGLTNFVYFVVGSLPERLEIEPNNETAKSESVQLPVVLNGRINPAADLDTFRFSGKRGQKIVAAIAAHALDIHGQGRNYGIADFSLELFDAAGRTLASAEDTLGFDPVIYHTLPDDGDYLVRVQLLNYQGFLEAVYRLTLGEVPYPTSVFPPGYRRGTPTEIQFYGHNIPPGTTRTVGNSTVAPMNAGGVAAGPVVLGASIWDGLEGSTWDPSYTLRHLALDTPENSGLDLPLVVGDHPESIEIEPNDGSRNAGLLPIPSTVNARFDKANDADWFAVRLEAQQKIQCEIVAQRFLRSPVDTLMQVYDAKDQLLIESDDEGFDPGYESYHDFKTTDSKLSFSAPAAGDYFIKVTEQSGVNGPRAVYRLTVQPERPEFRLSHFPDAVPIWGPGSTACVLVRIDRFSGFNEDVELTVEGLPSGWSSSSATSLATKPERPFNTYQFKVFLTITAPSDATVATSVPFRIVGRVKRADGTTLEHASIPLTLFYSSDTGFFRASPISRVTIAKSQGPWLEAVTSEISIPQGGSGNVIVKVHGAGDVKEMPIVVNLATAGVACGLTTPRNLPIVNGQVEVPLRLPAEVLPGTYGVTVAQTWRSDIRIGMPGPCTRLIKMTVVPAK